MAGGLLFHHLLAPYSQKSRHTALHSGKLTQKHIRAHTQVHLDKEIHRSRTQVFILETRGTVKSRLTQSGVRVELTQELNISIFTEFKLTNVQTLLSGQP